MRSMMALMAVVAMGCAVEGEPLEPSEIPNAEDELAAALRTLQPPATVFGCADVHVVAGNAADTASVTVTTWDGLVADANAAGGPIVQTYTLPHPTLAVTANYGTEVTRLECNDVIYPGPSIDYSADAISGTVTITVVPDLGYGGYFSTGFATVELDGVTFSLAGMTRTLPTFTLADVYVGWLPG